MSVSSWESGAQRGMAWPSFVVAALVSMGFSCQAGGAVAFLGDRGGACQTFSGTTGGAHAITLTSGVSSGSTLVVTGGTSVFAAILNVQDLEGNLYTSLNATSGAGGSVFQFASHVGPALLAGETVTVNYSSSTVGEVSCVSLHEFSGIPAFPAGLDRTGAASGNSSTPSATLSGPTSQPSELLIGTFVFNGSPGGISSSDSPLLQASSGNPGFFEVPFYRILSTTGTFSFSATLGTSQTWQAIVTSLKDTVVPVQLQKWSSE